MACGPRPGTYTSPRFDKAGQALVSEDGNIAEGHQEREQAILAAHLRGRQEPMYPRKENAPLSEWMHS